MATAGRTPALTPDQALAARKARRNRVVAPTDELPTDRTHWTVTSDGIVTDVASRAGAWSAATGAYTRGHSVTVRGAA
jgi:hypothetical protein